MRNNFVLVLFCSLLLHLILFFIVNLLPVPTIDKNSGPIEVTIEDRTFKNNPKQLVVQTLAPKNQLSEKNNDKLKFESEIDQRVKKQTQSKNIGKTQNAASPKAATDKLSQLLPENNSDFFYKQNSKKQSQTSNSQTSSIGQLLPDEIEFGEVTALNTDRSVYYSFYKRVDDMIRFPWESSVRNSIYRTPSTEFKSNSRGRWTTQIEVVVKSDGQIDSIKLLKPSGFHDFDEAAIQAFRQARLLPNPPKGMIKDDGLIHLNYSFEIQFDPNKVLARP